VKGVVFKVTLLILRKKHHISSWLSINFCFLWNW